MIRLTRDAVRMLPLVLALGVGHAAFFAGSADAVEIITVRSGNAPLGQPDPAITVFAGTGGAPLASALFASSDFDEACNGPQAVVGLGVPGAWAQGLACDPQARWVGIGITFAPRSALYCQAFTVDTCCIEQAFLTFCWTADDCLGDIPLHGGSNPPGVYLNGNPVTPTINGGTFATETVVGPIDVTGYLSCGRNYLQVYNRDTGFNYSGVMYSATLEIIECAVPSENTSWSQIKTLYR
ncbi:MAG: hypothetical protein Q8N51_15300 [Gammaproteobacteria bacterium]|jgi:hypothetical protein|nr:hypothetical protein [Gammaproteobacteria bacterium]